MKSLSLVFVILILLTCPAWAQDAATTVESHPVVIVTEGAPPETSVVCESGSTCAIEAPETPTESAPLSPLLQVIFAGVAILVAVSYALDKVGNRAKAVNENKLAMTAIEKAADGVPPAIVTPILDALERTTKALERITEFAKEATDKKPIIEKEAPPTEIVVPSKRSDYTTSSTGNVPADSFDTP